MFLIISFAFLPVEKTHRHYLSVCLAIATVIMQVRVPVISFLKMSLTELSVGIYNSFRLEA